MDAPWRIQLLGELRATRGDRVVTRFRSQKTAALLAYLAHHLHRSHPREVLIDLFWPESDPERGRQSLSMALSSLRHQLEPPGVPAGSVLVADRASVSLNPDAVTTDVAEFEAALRSAGRARSTDERAELLSRVVELYQGELLPGYFEDWLLPEQQRLADCYFEAVLQVIRHLEEAGDLHPAIQHACRAVGADPLREEAHHELIRLYAAAGQPADALRQYQKLERLLKEELGQEPSAETRALSDAIRSGVQAFRRSDVQEKPSPSALNARMPERLNALPSGTVTFLRTDIESSTAQWEQAGEAFRTALASHHALLRREFERHGGAEVKELGDGFLVAFARAGEALACALAAQRALAGHTWPQSVGTIQVRMALHTGDVAPEEGDYHGSVLNRVSRLVAVGHGGQILLSAATQELVQSDLPAGASLRDLGRHRLRDLERPEHIFQLVHPDLTAEFPPLRSLDATPNNLPLQLTSFIGRERQIAEVKRLLTMARLLTLTGPGGCGKTRLAQQVAADLLDAYADGVWLAELAALSDPALVPQTVASALGVREQPGRPFTETLVDYCKPRSLLLVLDNCEHLLAACAGLAESLLRQCSTVRILATSREGLGIVGEQSYRVPSLSLPDAKQLPPLERLQESDAVRLFTDRARLSQEGFAVTETNAVSVARVCQQLDGIPLAIELAAARVRALPVEEIAERLDDRFRLLTGGSRTALPRQQTLRALIDWSYNLLDGRERTILRRLSVFAGGWTVAAAEAICSGGDIEEWEVLDLLTRLIDKSLVVCDPGESKARYRLLETVRQYARDQLIESGESDEWRNRHMGFYDQLATRAAQGFRGADHLTCLEHCDEEEDNLRTALEWSLHSGGDAQIGQRLAGNLWWYWFMRSQWSEGRAWLLRALERAPSVQTAERGLVLIWLTSTGYVLGGLEQARAWGEESIAIYRECNDPWGLAFALVTTALVALYQRDLQAALAMSAEGVTVGKHLPKVADRAYLLVCHGYVLTALDPAAAGLAFEESASLWRQDYDPWGLSLALEGKALATARQGDFASARSVLNEAIAIYRTSSDKWSLAEALNLQGEIAARQGDDPSAATAFGESLRLYYELGEPGTYLLLLFNIGALALSQGHPTRAAQLLGAIEDRREAPWPPASLCEPTDYDHCLAATRASLGKEAFATAWAEGCGMTLEQAIQYVLEDALPTNEEP